MHLLITSTERRTPRFVESLSSSAKRFAGHPDEPLNIVTRTRSLATYDATAEPRSDPGLRSRCRTEAIEESLLDMTTL